MDPNPYAPPQEPDPLPQPKPAPFAWLHQPFHPLTLAIVGALIIPLVLGVVAALLG
jgi:hypothetical protein